MSGATIQFTLKADTAQGVAALEKMRTSMKDLNAATETTSKAGQTAFGGLMDTFGKLGALLAGGMVARQIYEIGKSCVTMAVNAVESENLFEVSMGKMAGAARSCSASYLVARLSFSTAASRLAAAAMRSTSVESHHCA